MREVSQKPSHLETSLPSPGSCGATLRFVVKDCDPATGLPDTDEGYEDEYLLEEVELAVADHVQRVLKANFAAAWDEIGERGTGTGRDETLRRSDGWARRIAM